MNLSKWYKRNLIFGFHYQAHIKLCDFRTAYGFVFRNWIKNYDLWGYCDNDLLFGNIRAYIDETILNDYDRCYIMGIYQSSETAKKNELYKFAEGVILHLIIGKFFRQKIL